MKQWECRVWESYKNKMHYNYEDITCWQGNLLAEGDSIILLYTGYKDKDNKKVYQHDLIDVLGAIKVVVWHAGGFCVVSERSMLDKISWYLPEWFGNIPQQDIKVVGNIYEHKHLLQRFKS